MKRKDILIEIGCEDLPYWAGDYLKDEWLPVFTSLLDEYRIEYGETKFFYTLRRVVVYIKSVSPRQKDTVLEIYGPPLEIAMDKEGKFTSAAEKFATSHGASIRQLVIKERKDRKVIALVKHEKAKSVSEIIGNILEESIHRLEIPRGMKWNGGNFRFLRPVRWVLALYGDTVIPFSFAEVKSSRFSYGHRVLAPDRFKVLTPHDYMDKLLKRFVLFDPSVRYEFIKAEIARKTGDKDFEVDEQHLKKIVSLVEYPVVEVCKLKDEYMEIPHEIISAVIMKLNGIPLYSKDGHLDKRYIAIFDGVSGDEVVNNYQQVIQTKMVDASFFMSKDMERDFDSYAEELKSISYHPKWGTIYEQVERFKKIYNILIEYFELSNEAKDIIFKIISLCRNDLPTLMVSEFPSLEGIIGRIYAEKKGYNKLVASGIEQHYWPRTSGDKLPETIESSIASVIVRLETICSFLLDNIEIKGSGDPYGLKRSANGLIEIIWRKRLDFPLREVISKVVGIFGNYPEETTEKIMEFILQRVDNLFAGEGISPGIRRAIMAIDRENLLILREKIDALKNFFKTGAAKNILVPFIRIANILKQAKEKNIIWEEFEESLLVEGTEKELYHFYRENQTITQFLDRKNRNYSAFLQQLSRWREIIDRFFDDVLVMSPDEKLRNNRLALLKKINNLFLLFADFSLIPVVEVENA